MKNFLTEIYEEALGKLTFPDYKNFGCVNKAYSDLTSKIFDVVSGGTYKTYQSKKQYKWVVWWRDCRKIAARNKLFRKFKKSKLNVDEIQRSKKYRASFN